MCVVESGPILGGRSGSGMGLSFPRKDPASSVLMASRSLMKCSGVPFLSTVGEKILGDGYIILYKLVKPNARSRAFSKYFTANFSV